MKIFDQYAQYYDLLYSTKKYEAEVDYVSSLIEKFGNGVKSMLDIGCGTGSHGVHFAQRGYEVVGIDLSPKMISLANEKSKQMGIKNISFAQEDIISLHMDREFDVVVSLFHVMNYLTKSSDMAVGFENAVNCVRSGGLFIFDSWYGPAVISDLPKTGVRRFENDRVKVTRLVEPIMHTNRNVVDVNYEIFVQEKNSATVGIINETHSVRYFFELEIRGLLEGLGIEILSVEEWLTGRPIGLDTFGVCFVGRKR